MQMPLGIVFGETHTWQASSCDAFRRSCGNQWRCSVALSRQSQPSLIFSISSHGTGPQSLSWQHLSSYQLWTSISATND